MLNHWQVSRSRLESAVAWNPKAGLFRQALLSLFSRVWEDCRYLALLLNVRGLTKSYGAAPLFRNISFPIQDGDRLGLIGPNGSGKSTLLEILAGRREPDTGEVAVRKGVRFSHVQQDSQFEPGDTVRSVIRAALAKGGVAESERDAREAETLGRTGFENLDAEAQSLSGGWRKRLAIASAVVQAPDLLLLDEPTNHLDLAGIVWLERLLQNASFGCVVVSHDRYFLENVATDMAELNRTYTDGLLRVKGNYSTFLEKKDEYLHAQAKRQEALENRVRTEIEWLRRGPKARTTKSKARIDKAQEMIGELSDLNARTRTATADLDFSATDRKTKRLVELDKVNFGLGGRKLFDDFTFTFTAGTRVGLVGPNGSGKTTLLRLLRDELKPETGEIRRADNLRIVYFDQDRVLEPDVTLAPRSGSRWRLRHLPGSRSARGFMGDPVSVRPGAVEPAGRPFIRGRAGPCSDREADAGASRPTVARRAHQ